jgi:hypothetical protein
MVLHCAFSLQDIMVTVVPLKFLTCHCAVLSSSYISLWWWMISRPGYLIDWIIYEILRGHFMYASPVWDVSDATLMNENIHNWMVPSKHRYFLTDTALQPSSSWRTLFSSHSLFPFSIVSLCGLSLAICSLRWFEIASKTSWIKNHSRSVGISLYQFHTNIGIFFSVLFYSI